MQRLLYQSGEVVHAGDRVDSCGHLGTVVFAVEQDEWTPEFPKEQWDYLEHGFMVREDDGTLIHYTDAMGGCITLLSRASTPG